MRVMSRTLPGIERIQARFLDLLGPRMEELEILCGDLSDEASRAEALKQSQNILHQIAGTAGTLGYSDFGESARKCEEMIIAFLDKGRHSLDAICREVGLFAEAAEDLAAAHLQPARKTASG